MNLVLVLTLAAVSLCCFLERKRLQERIQVLETVIKYENRAREFGRFLDEQKAMAHPTIIEFSND